MQSKMANICVSELSRYELSKPVAKFFDGEYQLFRKTRNRSKKQIFMIKS